MEELITKIREACKDITDYRPDYIEMRPDFYNYIKVNSEYMGLAKPGYIPYYYGIKIKIKEDLDKPFKIIREGKEIDE